MAEVFILLGGNVGDKSKIFDKTRKLIQDRIGMIEKMSSIYVTEPWGFESELFWNQVINTVTNFTPHEILQRTQAIESEMGRIHNHANYEARTMDIDLLFYDDLQLDTPDLSLPHSKMEIRRFVLVPLNEIAPDKRHPINGFLVREMLERCTDPLRVECIG